MRPNLNIICLGVCDLASSVRFYEQILGWPKHVEASSDQTAFFQLSGLVLELYQREMLAADSLQNSTGSGFRGFTLAHNVDSETEVDQLIKALRDQGVTIVKEPVKVFWGGYSSYFADPDGFLWEIAYNPFFKLDAAGNIAL